MSRTSRRRQVPHARPVGGAPWHCAAPLWTAGRRCRAARPAPGPGPRGPPGQCAPWPPPSPASPRRARRWTTSSRCAAARRRAFGCRLPRRPRPESAAPAQRYDVLSAGTGALACTMVFVANGQDPWTALSITAAATVTALVRPPRAGPGALVEQAGRWLRDAALALFLALSWPSCDRYGCSMPLPFILYAGCAGQGL